MSRGKPAKTGDKRIRRGSPVAMDGCDKIGRVIQALGAVARVKWDDDMVSVEARDELTYIGDRADIVKQRYARTGEAKKRELRRLAKIRASKCKCGAQAVERVRGKNICRECLCPPLQTSDLERLLMVWTARDEHVEPETFTMSKTKDLVKFYKAVSKAAKKMDPMYGKFFPTMDGLWRE